MKKYKLLLKLLLIMYFLTCSYSSIVVRAENEGNKNLSTTEEAKNAVENIYFVRSSAFIDGNIKTLESYYDTSQNLGKWSLEHEVKRIKYLNTWAKERGMKFDEVSSTLKVRKTINTKGRIKFLLDEYYKFQYHYKDDEAKTPNIFGVGIIHSVELAKKNSKWVIYSDWYTDCFEDALKAYNGDIKENIAIDDNSPPIFNIPNCYKSPEDQQKAFSSKFNRLKAVEYADKYCGIPWASGNNEKYNKKYKNFTGIGGNCTNYVSQCLGDKEGGGLKTDSAWYYVSSPYGDGAGSSAWANADGFKNYLIYSGRGRVLKRGTFKDIVNTNCTIISQLELGDLICYAKGKDIDHFAIITGFDSKGYPLINSHTTDRYHVPWDLGWGDKNIYFYIIKMR